MAGLLDALHQIDDGIADLPALVETSRNIHTELNDAMQRGRDRLLEYNSCRPHIANTLRNTAEELDKDTGLYDYLEMCFDCYGVESEVRSDTSYVVRPGEHMHGVHFPSLFDEGMTITVPLKRQDAQRKRRFGLSLF